ALDRGEPVDPATKEIADIGFEEPPSGLFGRRKGARERARERQAEFLDQIDAGEEKRVDMERAAKMRDFPNYFEILGATPDASVEELATRYEALQHEYTGTDPESVVQLNRLKAAYEILSDRKRRNDYDRLYLTYELFRRMLSEKYSGDSEFIELPGGTPTFDEVLIASDQRNG